MDPEPRTLLELLAGRARRGPDKAAFTFAGEATSFGELWRGVEEFAAVLRQHGWRRGERAVLALPNGGELFRAFYGVQRAGGIAVPIFPASGARRVLRIAGLCGARAIVAPGDVPEARQAELERGAGERGIVLLKASAGTGVDSTDDFPRVAADDVAYLQYTSGSTGDPKGVQLSHRNLLTNVRQMIAGMEITARDVFVSWLPTYHDMGLVLMTMVPFYLAAELHLLPASLTRVRPWLRAIERHRATFTAAPDFAYRLCLRAVQSPGEIDLSSLRVALDAAEPVRASTLESFEADFGLENVVLPGYGLAEATVGVSMETPGEPVRVDARGFVAVGQPFPEVEITIAGGDGPTAAGEVGEILVRSPANTRGYFANPAATDALLTADGALRTGDLGYLDTDGRLYIVGREKNVIISSGRNIAPREVEEVVDELAFVRRSAAVGIDRGRTEGEQVYVFAEVRPRQSRPPRQMVVEIVRAFRDALGFRPGRVYLVKPRAIPLTANGKLRYGELAASYLEGQLRREGKILFPDF